MKKVFISVIAVFFVLGGSVLTRSMAEAATHEFRDVHDSYQFYHEILYLVDEEIISGFADKTFRAEQTVTRAQAAIMIGKALGLNGLARNTTFPDVNSSVTGSGYIASAVQKGIISGFPDGTFRPYTPVTRGQMAIFLDNAFSFDEGQTKGFLDVSATMKAYQAIQDVSANYIAAGYPDGTYRPDQYVTRGQFAAFMARALEPSFRKNPNSLLPGLGNIRLGMTKEQVKAIETSETSTLKNEDSTALAYSNKRIFGLPAGVLYQFEGNRLVSVAVFHEMLDNNQNQQSFSSYFHTMQNKITEINGQPASLDNHWHDDGRDHALSAIWLKASHDIFLTTTMNADGTSFGGILVMGKE